VKQLTLVTYCINATLVKRGAELTRNSYVTRTRKLLNTRGDVASPNWTSHSTTSPCCRHSKLEQRMSYNAEI